jgi:hypothetical protein
MVTLADCGRWNDLSIVNSSASSLDTRSRVWSGFWSDVEVIELKFPVLIVSLLGCSNDVDVFRRLVLLVVRTGDAGFTSPHAAVKDLSVRQLTERYVLMGLQEIVVEPVHLF